MIRTAMLSLLLLATAPALARDCAHSAPRTLDLDLSGVKTVKFVIGHNELRIDASPGKSGSVSGQACASGASLLDQLSLTQHREGDRLVVTARREGAPLFSLGRHYAYMTLRARIPDDIPVELGVGSGDAWVAGVPSLDVSVGSGDVEARRIRGRVTASVGSGDIELDDIGPLHVSSIGSGDVKATHVHGDATVGSIGSGDLELKDVKGSVRIDSIGSGDAGLERIAGTVEVGSVGSGDVSVRGAAGLRVRSIGSGDVFHRDVTGTVDLPRRK
jgi:Uncharacterized conserved protein